jgi:hypothetical protein
MNTTQAQLDTVLQRLIDGERVEVLMQEFPAHAKELSSYAEIVKDLKVVASIVPPPEGLRRALSSMRVLDATRETEGARVRVSTFFMTYRTALVLPVLVVMLVATGAVALPLSMDEEPVIPAGDSVATESMNAEMSGTALSQRTAPPQQNDAGTVESAPTFFKSAQMSAPQETLPEDQNLASIFGDEVRNDSEDAASAQTAASEGADDSQDISVYDTTYDANDF